MLKNITPSLPEHGKIKAGTKGEEVVSKGGKRFRLPEKLNHYIITTTERDPKTDLLMLEKDLMDDLKKDKALVDSKGNLTSIPIRLLYNDINLNLFYRNACYVGGKCGTETADVDIALSTVVPPHDLLGNPTRNGQ